MTETMDLNDFLLQYPGLTVLGTLIEGPIKIQRSWYYIRLKCPYFPLAKSATLEVQKNHTLQVVTSDNTSRPPDATVFDLINQLPSFIHHSTTTSILERPPTEANIYAEITRLYAPQNYRIHLNPACTRIRFDHFAEHHSHYLELELHSLHLLAHSLPDCLPLQELLKPCTTLTAMLQQFEKFLEDLRPFYDNFIDIDELCYVVQPMPPSSTKHNWRLFVLRERVFLKLLIADPFAFIASMSVQIIGPTHEVEKLRHAFSDGLRDWDAELDIHKNLLRIFDLCFFPMPPGMCGSGADVAQQQFCNICYSVQLEEGEIPIVSCDNLHCTLIFHASCLKEWFNTLADGKDFLSVSLGACPFCKTKLSTSFTELLEN